MNSPRALVAGAGIGGLAAAISLRRAGFDPLILERADETREAGAGLLMSANVVAALHALGLHEAASGLGVPTTAGLLRNPSGEILADPSLPPERERLGRDCMAVSRPELHSALLSAVGESVVRTGSRVAGFRETDGGVAAVLEGGGEERGRILVGADGMYSTVRAALHGPHSRPPRYAGYTAWRGVARSADGLVPRGVGLETWGRGTRFGCVYIGGGRVYWFATQNAPEGARDAPGESRKRVLGLLHGWHEPVEELVQATPEQEIRRDDIYDRDPILRWGSGPKSPVTLLGDAAHPMTPNLGQGAGQALVDAAALGDALSRTPDPETGLRLYERRRAVPAAALVLISRHAGVTGQLQSPLLTGLRNRAFRAAPRHLKERQLRSMLGYGD